MCRAGGGRFAVRCSQSIWQADSQLAAQRDRQRDTIAILQATLDTMLDGVLVVDGAQRPLLYNRRLVDMWRIPEDIVAAARLLVIFI